jgi:hypothetical protein
MKWFKMDCDAQENLDMRKLVAEWGWDWYGRYHAIIGKVGMLVTEKRQTFALQTNNGEPFPVRLLADDLSTTVERLSTFCKYLADNRLIDKEAWDNKNLIFIPKLKERTDEYTARLGTKSRHCPDQEVEVDKKKKEIIYNVDFLHLWDKYPKPEGKKDAYRHFKSTVKTPQDLEDISKALSNYLKSGNIALGYIKNGSTWFNIWQDWINPTEQMMRGNNNVQTKPTENITRKYAEPPK